MAKRRSFLTVPLLKENGCWLWQGPVNTYGYGYLGKRLAHRYSYEVRVGPIPEGLTLDHLCRVKLCVNPDHLEPVTLQENIARAAFNSGKTHCPAGHAYSGTNLIVRTNKYTRRFCRTCANARRRNYPQYRSVA